MADPRVVNLERLKAAVPSRQQQTASPPSPPSPIVANLNRLMATIERGLPPMAGTRLGGTALGATTGAALGMPLGPPGVFMGAVGGAMIGRGVTELGIEVEKRLGVVPSGVPTVSGLPLMQEMVTAGAGEAFGVGLGQLIRTAGVLMRPVVRGAMGIPRDMLQLAKGLQAKGVELLPIDLALRRWPAGFAEVLGRFPFIGGPMRAAKEAQRAQAFGALSQIPEAIGPITSQTARGRAAIAGAKQQFQTYANELNRLYGEFRRLAEDTGATVGTTITKRRGGEVMTEIRKGRPVVIQKRKVKGKEVEFATPSPPTGELKRVFDFARRHRALGEEQTVAQARGLLNDWQQLMGGLRDGNSRRLMMQLKGAIQEDFETSLRGVPEVLAAKKAADKFLIENAPRFETPSAQEFGRVTPNIFRETKPRFRPTQRPATLARRVLPLDDAQAVRDLRGIVGEPAFRQNVAGHISDRFSKAVRVDRQTGIAEIDIVKIREDFGLTGRNPERLEAFQEMLKGTGVKLDDVNQLMRGIEVASRTQIPGAAQFVARRAVLGGARAGIRAAVPLADPRAQTGFGTSLNVFASLGGLLGLRAIGRILTNPKMLSLAKVSFSEEAGALRANAALIRLVRLVQDSIEQEAPTETDLMQLRAIYDQAVRGYQAARQMAMQTVR